MYRLITRSSFIRTITLMLLAMMSIDAAVAGSSFCVSDVNGLKNQLNYWSTSGDDVVTIELIEGFYDLSGADLAYQQQYPGGSAALRLLGGYLSCNQLDTAPDAAAQTIVSGGSLVLAAFHIPDFGSRKIQNIDIENMAFSEMVVPSGASPIYLFGNHVNLSNIIVHGTTSSSISSVQIWGDSSILIANSLFYSNSNSNPCAGCMSAAVYLTSPYAEVFNATFASNTTNFGLVAYEDSDNRIGSGYKTHLVAVNDIFWGNTKDIAADANSSVNIYFSDYSTTQGNVVAGAGTFSADPLFTNAVSHTFTDSRDFALQAAPRANVSPAVNKGATGNDLTSILGPNVYSYPAMDLAGYSNPVTHVRIKGTKIDLGPYESGFDDHQSLSSSRASCR